MNLLFKIDNMKALSLLGLSLLLLSNAMAQNTQSVNDVMKPIHRLFEGMKKGDSVIVRSVFTKQVTMATVFKDKTDAAVITYESSIDEFLKSVGTPHSEAFNEMIWGEKISIDENFAQVWVDYAFYLGKKLNHCGVDAFHLMKDRNGNWRIFHLADTRRKEGCNIPKHISDQFK